MCNETSEIFVIHFVVICSQANLLPKARLQFDTYGIIWPDLNTLSFHINASKSLTCESLMIFEWFSNGCWPGGQNVSNAAGGR